MNFEKACSILELKSTFTKIELKKAYYRLALKYHPDKNPDDFESNEKFRELHEAYKFLGDSINIENEDLINEENETINFKSLFNKFINLMTEKRIDVTTILSTVKTLKQNYQSISIKVFEDLHKETAISVLEYIENFSGVLGIKNDIIHAMKKIIKDKTKNDTLIILNPTLENLFNEDVYELKYDEHTHYVPLWHDEITYDLSGQSITVKCIPDIPEHVYIDQKNNINININIAICDILDRIYIPIKLGNKTFDITVEELNIKKTQQYVFYDYGIPVINVANLFDNKKKSNIIVNITLVNK